MIEVELLDLCFPFPVALLGRSSPKALNQLRKLLAVGRQMWDRFISQSPAGSLLIDEVEKVGWICLCVGLQKVCSRLGRETVERGRSAETCEQKTDRGIERDMARIDNIMLTVYWKQICSDEDREERKMQVLKIVVACDADRLWKFN